MNARLCDVIDRGRCNKLSSLPSLFVVRRRRRRRCTLKFEFDFWFRLVFWWAVGG